MTRKRWGLLVVGALTPLILTIVLLSAVIGGQPRVGAAIALGLLLAASAAAFLAVARVVRRYRRVRSILDGESIDFDAPSARVLECDPVIAAWPDGARILAGRALGLPADVVAGFGMATRSPFALDHLARLATRWRLGTREIAEIFGSTDDPTSVRSALGRVDAATLLLFARTAASQNPDEPAVPDAIARYVARTADVAGLPISSRHWLAERLVMAGALEQAAALVGVPSTTHAQLVAIDTLNPFIPGARMTDAGAWRAALTGVFARAGLEGVDLRPGDGAPFDRLRALPAPHVDETVALVTVVMTTHRPDAAALATAVDSVISQTWAEWELLIVDDGSPAEFVSVLENVAARDERIKLIRAEANAGTYVRRNEAILAAHGRYVTMHDSDDWMHPRRLETQVRHLEAHPELLANVCRSARVTPELRFVQRRGTLLRLTEASLLFRRAETVERVGFFDSVRKGADTGFRLRIEAATERSVPVIDVEAPLILSRYDDGSLSGSDLRDGWTHPSRVAYSSAHAAWVAAERAARRAPRIDFPLTERPFPAPAELRGEADDPVELDVLFIADVREDPARARRQHADELDLRAAVDAGLRVGLRRLDAPSRAWIPPITRRRLQELINTGAVTELLPARDVSVTTVVVLEELVLLGAPPTADGLVADRVLVVEGSDSTLRSECHAGVQRLIPSAESRVVSRSEARRAVDLLAR